MASTSSNKSKQSFKGEYSAKWDFIKASKKGENHVRCTLCCADFSIAASGSYDISQHIKTVKHRSFAGSNNQSITQFMVYRFLMKNTGFGVSEYSFVIPEVGMSALTL